MDNPPCTADAHAKTLGQALVEKGIEGIGKASAVLGLPGDPFNTRRLNQSVCMDLCVIVPQGASFTAKGGVSDPYGWRGDLPAGLPELVNPGNWWAIIGPSVESTARGDVVCYTAKNWSHNLERHVGIEVKY
ncbi:hypothetical protein [Massilia varians]|nr:hypothetical protein [Massilia varians]